MKVQQTERTTLECAVCKKERNSEPQNDVWLLSNGTIRLTISKMMGKAGRAGWVGEDPFHWNLTLMSLLDLMLQCQVGSWTYKLGVQQRSLN